MGITPIELTSNLSEPKVIDENIKKAIKDTTSLSESEKVDISFIGWIGRNLMKPDIFIACFLMFFSIVLLLYSIKTGNLKYYNNYGIISNLIISITYLLFPISKSNNYSVKNFNINNFSEDRIEKVKNILNIETTYALQSAYTRALNELNEFTTYWRFVWIGWFLFYFYWLFTDIIFANININMNIDKKYFSGALESIIGNISSLFIMFSFLVLYFRRENVAHNNMWKFIFSVLVSMPVFIFFAEGGEGDTNVILGSLFAGLAISLLSGRLDSKFLSIPFGIIIMLYFYALIQLMLKDFNNLEIKSISINIALFSKGILMILFSWLVSSNRFLYYLIVANQKEYRSRFNMENVTEYI